jgi:fatty acid desaturase
MAATDNRLRVAIQGRWYDMSSWAKVHPGGRGILEKFQGIDATEQFFAIHSKTALAKFDAMKESITDTSSPAPQPHPLDQAWAKLRAKAQSLGLYNRSFWQELRLALLMFGFIGAGTYFARSRPALSITLLSLGFQQAGWMGHDMAHARNSTYTKIMTVVVSGWIGGLSTGWWSNKHNLHHFFTNEEQIDPDINNQPFVYLWAPKKSEDSLFRQYQHYLLLPYYLWWYASWRYQSLKWVIRNGQIGYFLTVTLPGYAFLATLPASVALPALAIGGGLVGMIITTNHESEQMLTAHQPSFVLSQYLTTRNIVCSNFITEYMFGGMQYQLEHHMLPTIPRYNLHRVTPLIKEFGQEQGLTVYESGDWEMLRDHYRTVKKYASVEAIDD